MMEVPRKMAGNTSSELLVAPVYENLFNLPVVVFCQFISDARSGVTDNQIAKVWVEFSNYGRDRADKAKRKIDDWRVEWNTTWFTLPDLSERIKAVVDDAVSHYQIDIEWVPKPSPSV